MGHDADLHSDLEMLRAENVRLREAAARMAAPEALDVGIGDGALLEALSEGVVIEDERGVVVACNSHAERLLGLSFAEMANGTWVERWRAVREDGTAFPNEEHPAKITARTGEPVFGSVMGIARPTGQLTWVSVNARPLVRRDGRRAVASTFTDITAQRVTRLALEESESRLKSALAAGRIGVWEWDIASGRLLWTPPLHALFDLDPNTLVTFDLYQRRLHPDDRANVIQTVRTCLDEGNTPYVVEHRIVRRNGEVRWVRATGQVLRDKGGEPRKMLGAALDVTDQRLQQERRLQGQRMEAIGQLAGGIAHDFNNVLTAVLGALEEARFTLGDDAGNTETLNAALDTIDAGASHAVALTRQLLAFAKKQVLSPKHTRLDALIDSTRELLRHVLSANIDLDVQTHCSPWTAHIDPTQLQQVLVNLAVNARDAMPTGGTLTIRAMKHARGSASLPAECAAGDWLNIDVEDDGCGIPEEIVGRIFEPFFSTKEAGTGLGLATSFGIVEQSGGHLKCTSTPGHGARFSIWLPRSTAPDQTAVEDPSKPRRLANATILLVEDQLPVLEVVRRTLTRVGFEVTACRRPRDALLELERNTRFDLLLSDVVMPEMSGPELASIVRERSPETPVLFMSGYSGEHLMNELRALPRVAFLKKPFRPQDLVDRVNAMLETPLPPRHD